MENGSVTFFTVGICVALILLVMFAKPLKLLGKAAINGVIGIFALIGTNFLLSGFGLSVGVNMLTVLIVGILGIPGFISLYICQLLL